MRPFSELMGRINRILVLLAMSTSNSFQGLAIGQTLSVFGVLDLALEFDVVVLDRH